MKINRGLHLTKTHDSTPDGFLHYARNIMLDKTFNHLENEDGFSSFDFPMIEGLCGLIEYDKGVFIFGKITIINDEEEETTHSCIFHLDVTEYSVDKILIFEQYDFNKNFPIRGVHSYNISKESILSFSSGVNGNFEDIVLNFDEYDYTDLDISGAGVHFLTDKETYLLPLNANISFPEITSKKISGSLLSGAYQIAIAYVRFETLTNFSLLSLPE
jgi:hypothetical protein